MKYNKLIKNKNQIPDTSKTMLFYMRLLLQKKQ